MGVGGGGGDGGRAPFKYGPEPLVYRRDLASVRIPGLPWNSRGAHYYSGRDSGWGLSRHYLNWKTLFLTFSIPPLRSPPPVPPSHSESQSLLNKVLFCPSFTSSSGERTLMVNGGNQIKLSLHFCHSAHFLVLFAFPLFALFTSGDHINPLPVISAVSAHWHFIDETIKQYTEKNKKQSAD